MARAGFGFLDSVEENATERSKQQRAAEMAFAAEAHERVPKKTSNKRKSDEADLPANPINLDDIDVEDMPVTDNCDQVRRKINRFLDNSGMKKGEFAKAIGLSTANLNRFLGQSGPYKGSGCVAYDAAWAFFKKREIAGLKMPTKKAKTAEGETSGTKASKKQTSTADVDISAIHLDGQEDDAVPVYDSADEIRKKINAHLKKPGVTQAQFLRDIYAELHGVERPARPPQSSQLEKFRGKKGARAGCTSVIFYGAYVFFEKIRIAQNKPKSKHREEMEDIWAPKGGFDREHDGRHGYVAAFHMPLFSWFLLYGLVALSSVYARLP
jgi:hypothetical protein